MDPQMNTNNGEGNEAAGGFELCIVCGDKAHGIHYGAMTCEDCKEFFKRSIDMTLRYECRGSMNCEVTIQQLQNCCQYCRLQKCLACGMMGDSVPYHWRPIIFKVMGEARDLQVVTDTDSPSRHTQINRKEKFYATSRCRTNAMPPYKGAATSCRQQVSSNPNLAENMSKFVPPYQGAATSCRQQVSLNTDLAENMAKFGAMNLQSPCMAPRVQKSNIASPVQNPLAAPLEDDNNHDVVITPESVPFPPRVPPRTNSSPVTHLKVAWQGGLQLLYALTRWLMTLPAAAAMPTEEQDMLFRNRWSGLFALGLAQWEVEMDMDTLLPILVENLEEELRNRSEFHKRGVRPAPQSSCASLTRLTVENYADEELVEITTLMYRLRIFIRLMQKLKISDQEYAHLRALYLFSADSVPESLSYQLQELQLKVARSLRKLCKDDNDRFAILLLQLPTLRNFSRNFIEDMFFAEYFGELSVDDVVPLLLDAERK